MGVIYPSNTMQTADFKGFRHYWQLGLISTRFVTGNLSRQILIQKRLVIRQAIA